MVLELPTGTVSLTPTSKMQLRCKQGAFAVSMPSCYACHEVERGKDCSIPCLSELLVEGLSLLKDFNETNHLSS